jgi:hypothetical protein
LWWAAAVVSLAAFPVAAVHLARRASRRGVLLLWAGWVGPLVFYGAWLGAPQMSAVLLGVPLAAAGIAAVRSTGEPRAVAIRRAFIIMALLIVPSFFGGLWWGIVACEGQCL